MPLKIFGHHISITRQYSRKDAFVVGGIDVANHGQASFQTVLFAPKTPLAPPHLANALFEVVFRTSW